MLSFFEYFYVFICIFISLIVLNQSSPNNSMGSFSGGDSKKFKFDLFMKFSISLIIIYLLGALYINYKNKDEYNNYIQNNMQIQENRQEFEDNKIGKE